MLLLYDIRIGGFNTGKESTKGRPHSSCLKPGYFSLLAQLVGQVTPASTGCEGLAHTRSLEASARQETVLSVKLLLVVHGREVAASIEPRYEDLGTGEAGAGVAGAVYTSSQQNS